MSEQITVDINGHVALITFANPPLNFATVGLLRLLANALEQLDQQPQVRAIVLASSGKIFCAGADLISANGFGAEGNDPLREFYDQALRIYRCHKPIVTAVQGAAIGAGLGLAVVGDFRVATTDARFSANFVKLGFHPGFGLTYTLPRLIGVQRANQMFLTGDRYKAEDVMAWGLVDEMAESDDLLNTAMAFANRIASNGPLALLATRATLRSGLVEQVSAAINREHQQQLLLQPTADFAEGVRANADRRPGNFTGR